MAKALIFIPGIKGTKLYDRNTPKGEILWQDVRFNFENFENLTLSFEDNGRYFDEQFDTIVEPLNIEPIAYNQFWKKLQPNYNWKFIFPYDWRLPNKENGKRLKAFMEFIIEKSNALKKQNIPNVKKITSFDFVTHSMGNMPLRSYILENGFAKINKIVFVAPPFQGSLDAVSALLVGQGLFFNKEETRKLARSLPALFELLPRYFGNNKTENGNTLNLFKAENWQSNITKPRDPDKKRYAAKFMSNLNNASNQIPTLDQWISQLTSEELNRIIILTKTEEKTLTSIPIIKSPEGGNQPQNLFNFRKALHTEAGDGVVQDKSSCCYYKKIATYTLLDEFFRDDKSHAFLMRDNRIQRIINSFINHSNQKPFEANVIGNSVKKVSGFETIEKGSFKYKKVKY